MTASQFESRFKEYREKIEAELSRLPYGEAGKEPIAEAMRYSLLAGGKRLRPIFCLEAARMAGGSESEAMPVALAMECIHTYSLIHDDLPCMDDDELRRGRPTSHVVYGEAMALLAGDALLNYAFEILTEVPAKHPECRLAAAAEVANCAGLTGMIGGQVLDITNETDTEKKLTRMCLLKTGALIRGALRGGCRSGGGSDELLSALTEYAECIGLAFQMQDDALDVIGDAKILGKNTGSDEKDGKTTFASLFGVDGCLDRARKLTEKAKAAIEPFPEHEFLSALADVLMERKN